LDGQPGLYRDRALLDEPGYYSELLNRELVRFVESAPEPFFLLAQPPAPHPPMQAPAGYLARFPAIANDRRRCYAAMMACLDDGFGAMTAALAARGVHDRTATIFASDHGWDTRPIHAGASTNGGLRGGKYHLTEGGLRVPCLAAGPGLDPGVHDEPAWAVDLHATVLDWAGLRSEGEGRSLLTAPAERTLAWQFNDALVRTGEQRAALRGRWKYLLQDGVEALYDVVADPGETVDRRGDEPALLRRLKSDWERWWSAP
jgi:arylsulfatase A-like enzyme